LSIERGSVIGFQEYEIPYLKPLEKEPRVLAERQFLTSLLAGGPYRIGVDSHALEGATQAGAASWLKRWLIPNDATLVVGGDCGPKEIQKLVADSFGNWKKARTVAPPPPPAALVAEGLQRSRAVANMMNQGVINGEIKRATMGFPFEVSPEESLESVTGEEVRTDLEQCLRSPPTFSIVGDEATVRAALKEGWK